VALMSISRKLLVLDPSGVGEARRDVQEYAESLGFDEPACAKVGLIATEAASNIVKHAVGGMLLLRTIAPREAGRGNDPARGIEILALDSGPGIENVLAAQRDGFSTSGTLGAGLGAISRLASSSEVYSNDGKGVALVAQSWPRSGRAHPPAFEVGAVNVPVAGELESGDGWATEVRGARCHVLVVDGLGHGPLAAIAAGAAIETFRARIGDRPQETIEHLHLALRPTRGAAALVGELDAGTRTARWCGIGNVAASTFTAGVRRQLVSMNGTLGHGTFRSQQFQAPWPAQSLLVVTTDGIGTRWDLESYPGLERRHPSIVAGVVYRDFGRERDDATVLVVSDRNP
jgi:anti-sigma regulatory factor (Ser/Thr protein kinase)